MIWWRFFAVLSISFAVVSGLCEVGNLFGSFPMVLPARFFLLIAAFFVVLSGLAGLFIARRSHHH